VQRSLRSQTREGRRCRDRNRPTLAGIPAVVRPGHPGLQRCGLHPRGRVPTERWI